MLGNIPLPTFGHGSGAIVEFHVCIDYTAISGRFNRRNTVEIAQWIVPKAMQLKLAGFGVQLAVFEVE